MHVLSRPDDKLASGAPINLSVLQALWQSILSVHRFVHHPCSSSVAVLVCKVITCSVSCVFVEGKSLQ